MIHITEFDKQFYGKSFKDRTLGMQSDLTCIGYGANEGSPFFIGMYVCTSTGTVNTKTVLMKNAEFKPTPAAS